MGQRVIYFSDLTNKIIEDARKLERVVIVRHPALENGPVELEVAEDEVEFIRSGALSVVSVKLPQSNGSASETVTMGIEAFNRLAGREDIADVLRRALPVNPPRKEAKAEVIASTPSTPAAASAPTKPAAASAKENCCGIWPWLVGFGLAMLVLGLLAYTGLLTSLGVP